MRDTAEDKATYKAEGEAERKLGLLPLSRVRAAGLLLRKLLPPPMIDTVTFMPYAATRQRGKFATLAEVEHEDGHFTLYLPDPVPVLILTHEAAHILCQAHERGFGHDDLFRTTHLWCVRQVYGFNKACLLGAAYDRKGLGHA